MDNHLLELFQSIVNQMNTEDEKVYNEKLLMLYGVVDAVSSLDISLAKDMFDTYQSLIHHELTNDYNKVLYNICYARYLFQLKDDHAKEIGLKAYQKALNYDSIKISNKIQVGLNYAWILEELNDYHQAISICEDMLTRIDENHDIVDYLFVIAELSSIYFEMNQLINGEQYYQLFMKTYIGIDDEELKERLSHTCNILKRNRKTYYD